MRTFDCFELLGYHIDHYQDGRYMGSLKVENPDRETCGYLSRQYETAKEDIIFKKKVIRKGTEYYTELIPICGRVVGDIFKLRKNKYNG